MIQRVLTGVLVYELVALHTSLPTITTIVHTARSMPWPVYALSVAVVVAGVGWLAHHLLLDGWPD